MSKKKNKSVFLLTVSCLLFYEGSNSMLLKLKSITTATLLCRHFYSADFYCKRYLKNDTEIFVQLHKATKQQSGESNEPNPGSRSLSALVLRRDGKERHDKSKPCRFACSLKGLSGWVLMKGKLNYWLPLLGRGEKCTWRNLAFEDRCKKNLDTQQPVYVSACRVQDSKEGCQMSGSEKVRCLKLKG